MFWPQVLKPNLPTAMVVERAAQLPYGPEWQYEYSWPGERVLAVKRDASVQLISAAHRRDLTNRFPVIVAAMAKLTANYVVFDGVIRSIEQAQASVFAEAMTIPAGSAAQLRLIATDVLWIDECDMRQQSLPNRKQRLAALVAGSGIMANLTLEGPPGDIIQMAQSVGADGVLAKRRDSRYRPFARAGDWVRVSFDSVTGAVASGHPSSRANKSSAPGPFGAGWGAAIT
jgi:bifunctional non-homologous end joining protein LigD